MLARNPGFGIVVVVCLAVGVGLTTAFFSIAYETMLRPLPHYHQPHKLVFLSGASDSGSAGGGLSYADLEDWRRQSVCLANVSAYCQGFFYLTGSQGAEEVYGLVVFDEFFKTLGIKPHLGRMLDAADYRGPGEPVMVISHRLWAEKFASDPAVIGQKVTVNNRPAIIVGVLPPGFIFKRNIDIDVITPCRMLVDFPISLERNSRGMLGVARLAPGIRRSQAQAEADAIGRQLASQYPATNAGRGLALQPFNYARIGDFRLALRLLLGAAGLVLMIGCVNVASLVLMRIPGRWREMAIRSSLGAGWVQLARQLLVESLQLALLGGMAGVILAGWAVNLFVAWAPEHALRLEKVRINLPMLAFSLALSVAAGVIITVFPAVRMRSALSWTSIYSGGNSSTESRFWGRCRGGLVMAEVAMTLILLAGAALMLNSFWGMANADLGFNEKGLLVVECVPPPGTPRVDRAQDIQKARDVLERVGQVQGVRSVAAVDAAPFISGGGVLTRVQMPGGIRQTTPEGEEAREHKISDAYFQTMQIELVRGRNFGPADMYRGRVAIVNRAMAELNWPEQGPLGQTLKKGTRTYEIIGVVENVSTRGLDEPVGPEYYLPDCRLAGWCLVVRCQDHMAVSRAVKEAIAGVEPEIIAKVQTMEHVLARWSAQPRFVLLLLAAFASVAVLLCVVGVYGTTAYWVNQRVREFGIRMALGAQRGDVVGLVLRQAAMGLGVGVAIGLAGALGLTRYLTSLLYEISPTDPLTFAGVAIFLMGAGLLACYLPARRATRIDPMASIRYE